jgi:general secretion pathway protein D
VQSAVQSAFIQRVLPGFNLLLGPEAQPRVILSALSTLTQVKVLSAPSLVVMDNQPALLQVGDEIPISTGVATVLSNANTPVVNTIEMRNTGVILKVLPHVHANGTIQLEIEQEISNVVNPAQQTLTPTISQRRVHSTVAVTSGQTVLLGGLISEQEQKTKAGIPGLNEIEVLGNLFGTTSRTKQRSEIIMFIKPQLVRNSVDARRVAEEFRDRLEMMRPTRSVVIGADPPVLKR